MLGDNLEPKSEKEDDDKVEESLDDDDEDMDEYELKLLCKYKPSW